MKSSTKSKKKIKHDPKHIGVPNICFSLTDADDNREPHFKKQRLERGFDDSETWSLRDTMARFILPRLKRYREMIDGFIVNENGLYEDVDKAIRAFELVIKDDTEWMTKEEQVEYRAGMDAFARIYMALWW